MSDRLATFAAAFFGAAIALAFTNHVPASLVCSAVGVVLFVVSLRVS